MAHVYRIGSYDQTILYLVNQILQFYTMSKTKCIVTAEEHMKNGGLGHLTRVTKLIITLNIPKDSVIIITASHFTSYFIDYQFVKLSWSDTSNTWINVIKNVFGVICLLKS